MKKIIILSLVLPATLVFSCKKKDDPEASNIAPTVTLTSPTDNTGPKKKLEASYPPISLAATASDSDGSISKVEFYNGTTLLGEDTSAPYTLETSGDPGTYTFTAKAYDNKNASTTSATVNYIVDDATVK